MPEVWEDEASEDGWETVDSDEEQEGATSNGKKTRDKGKAPKVPTTSAATTITTGAFNNQIALSPFFEGADYYDDGSDFGWEDDDEDLYNYDNFYDGDYDDYYDEDGEDGEEEVDDDLITAVLDDDQELLEELMADEAVNMNEKFNGRTALHEAAVMGKAHFVRELLNCERVDANVRNDLHGHTPLHEACIENYPRAVREFLLSHKVDLSIKDDNHATSFWLAVQNGHGEVVKWFLASGRVLEGFDSSEKENEIPDSLVAMIAEFKLNPSQARASIRKELGIFGLRFFLSSFFASFFMRSFSQFLSHFFLRFGDC